MYLVRNGLLTHDQAEQFLRGKSRCFTIGPYTVLDQLGAGGMGSVLLCEHVGMGRVVAVKVLHRSATKDDSLFPPTARSDESSSLERFHREALAGLALNHPNIMRVFDMGEDKTNHYLVMEYVDGVSLQEIVRKSGPLSVVRATQYVGQAALGLQHAHAAGVVHRDIKPGNIMVNRNGVVKILDMGLARFGRFAQDQDSLTRNLNGTVLGTPDYFAPEQAEDPHTVDVRADVYSLGATFYYCLTGSPPFGRGTVLQIINRHQFRPPPSVRDHRPDVPEGLAAVITKMLAKNPADRYQNLAEVCTALKPWNSTAILPPTEQEMPGMSPAERNRLVAAFRKAAPPRPSSLEQALSKLPGRSDAGPGGDVSTSPPDPVSLPAGNETPALEEPPEKVRIVKDALAIQLLSVVLLVAVMSGILLLVGGVIAFLIWGPQLKIESIPKLPRKIAPILPKRIIEDPSTIWRKGPARLPDKIGEIARLPDGPGGSAGVAFSPDGRQVAAAGADGIVRVWEILKGPSLDRAAEGPQRQGKFGRFPAQQQAVALDQPRQDDAPVEPRHAA